MRRKIILVLVCCMCLSGTSYAKGGKFWNGVKRALGGLVKAASVVVVERAYEYSGYSKEEAQKQTRNLYSDFKGNIADKNIEKGLALAEAENKYARQNIIKDYVFDFAAEVSNNPNVINKMRTIADGQFGYLENMSKAKTVEDKQKAKDSLTRVYAVVIYDTYQEAKSERSKRLAERMRLAQQLKEKGEDPQLAEELAGSIIAVRNSTSMSEEEKTAYYRACGLIDDASVVAQVVDEVSKAADSSNVDAEALKQKALQEEAERKQKEEAERKQKEEAERLMKQKEAEAKNNAIKCIDEAVVAGFLFDKTDLSDEQKKSVDEVAELLVKYEDVNIELVGHTCNHGGKSVNKRVGLKRADAVKAYLVTSGVSEDRVTTDSKGASEPKIQNPTLNERKHNRRVEFNVK